ncbi:MAG TPA: DUF1614 domain-containing protein [Gallionella sp.]
MPPLPRLLIFMLIVIFLVSLVQIGLIGTAFDKLGLSAESGYLLLLCTLAGSLINLPLFSLSAVSAPKMQEPKMGPPAHWMFYRLPAGSGRVVVLANVGGAVVPVAFSLYLIAHYPLNPFDIAIAVAVVTAIARRFSFQIPGIGIGIPMLLAPIAAALVATALDPLQRAPLAYIAGTLGVLIGADLLGLGGIRKQGATFAIIGGAGTFDGVFLTGLVAVLLA